jgi:serine/threonine-protein kinase
MHRLTSALADRYRIERELGQGGMATAYLAEDLKHHREVALKVLRPELAATLGSDRFLREIEVAARLHHPHPAALRFRGGGRERLERLRFGTETGTVVASDVCKFL